MKQTISAAEKSLNIKAIRNESGENMKAYRAENMLAEIAENDLKKNEENETVNVTKENDGQKAKAGSVNGGNQHQ
jgi:hypothetical protein